MKVYVSGIVMGVIAIVSSLLFVGVPFGISILEIVNTALFIVGFIAVLLVGLAFKKPFAAMIISILYVVSLFILTLAIESGSNGFTLVAVGFIPGLVIAATGLISSLQIKSKKKILPSMIVNILAILVACANVYLSYVNGGFIIVQ